MNTLNKNQVVLVSGYIAVVTEVYENHVAVNVSFNGKVVSTVVEKSAVKEIKEKSKYSKDEQQLMFGRTFSLGFIQIVFMNIDFENYFGVNGMVARVSTAKNMTMIQL